MFAVVYVYMHRIFCSIRVTSLTDKGNEKLYLRSLFGLYFGETRLIQLLHKLCGNSTQTQFLFKKKQISGFWVKFFKLNTFFFNLNLVLIYPSTKLYCVLRNSIVLLFFDIFIDYYSVLSAWLYCEIFDLTKMFIKLVGFCVLLAVCSAQRVITTGFSIQFLFFFFNSLLCSLILLFYLYTYK